jgi:hypothetical protein
VLFARLFGRAPRPYFKAAEGADVAPAVNFNFGKGASNVDTNNAPPTPSATPKSETTPAPVN